MPFFFSHSVDMQYMLWTYLEGAHQCLIDTHHGAGIVKLAAVVRCWEQSHQLPLRKELVAVFYHLSITRTTQMQSATNNMLISQSMAETSLKVLISK